MTACPGLLFILSEKERLLVICSAMSQTVSQNDLCLAEGLLMQ